MARTTKKRAKELKHDKFRDTTFDAYGRLSHRFEGKGRTILYAVAGVVALVALLLVFNWWRERLPSHACVRTPACAFGDVLLDRLIKAGL